jgi:hypothetical protein
MPHPGNAEAAASYWGRTITIVSTTLRAEYRDVREAGVLAVARSDLLVAKCAHLAIVVPAFHRGNRSLATPAVMTHADALNVAEALVERNHCTESKRSFHPSARVAATRSGPPECQRDHREPTDDTSSGRTPTEPAAALLATTYEAGNMTRFCAGGG